MKLIYCLKCKCPIEVVHVALPKYSKTVEAIEPHTCQTTEEVEWQFPINPAPTVTVKTNPNDEIVKILNDLDSDKRDPKDLRKELSSAPPSILKQLRRDDA